MSNEEKILELLQAMDARLDRLETGQAELKAGLVQLQEDHEITRAALNHLIEWSDEVSEAVKFPLPKS